LLWATVTIYYAEYYALYSFLQRIGIKCENHSCSILLASFLLDEDKVKIISEHKDKRIDAQYYMKVGQEGKIKTMLIEAQFFISYFDELISPISAEEIKEYRGKIFCSFEDESLKVAKVHSKYSLRFVHKEKFVAQQFKSLLENLKNI